MRVITWNMGYWGHAKKHDSAWHWLFDQVKPDIALLQECRPPDWVYEHANLLFERAYPNTPNHRWGTALMTVDMTTTRESLIEIEEWYALLGPEAPNICSATRLNSWCVSAQVTFNDLPPVHVNSVHNPAYPIDRKLLTEVDVSDIRLKLNKDVWLLDVLFYFLKNRLDSPHLVGGDFNYSRLLDNPKPRGNNEFFDRIAEEGFISLHRLFHDSDQQTFFHPDRRKHQLDYLYANSVIADLTTNCNVIPYQQVKQFSDHAPILAELEIM